MGNNPTPKPIDVCNQEIRFLKMELSKLRSELTLIKSQFKSVREDYLKRKADEEEKDKECVIENKSWWWG